MGFAYTARQLCCVVSVSSCELLVCLRVPAVPKQASYVALGVSVLLGADRQMPVPVPVQEIRNGKHGCHRQGQSPEDPVLPNLFQAANKLVSTICVWAGLVAAARSPIL